MTPLLLFQSEQAYTEAKHLNAKHNNLFLTHEESAVGLGHSPGYCPSCDGSVSRRKRVEMALPHHQVLTQLPWATTYSGLEATHQFLPQPTDQSQLCSCTQIEGEVISERVLSCVWKKTKMDEC